MKKNFEQILKELDDKKYQPIYFLTGEEPYFIDNISNYMVDNILNKSEKDFNLTIIYGKETNPQHVIEQALRYPMMAPYNIIIVKEAQELKNIEQFKSYFQKPNETSILVFCYKYKKIDKRTKFYKVVEENTCFFEGKKVYENNISSWIQKYLDKKGFRITQQASLLLTEYLGNNLSKITNEVDKLILVNQNSKNIDLNDIENHIGISREYNIFELQKALSNKDYQKVTKIFNYIQSNPKSTPLQLLITVLFTYFSKVHALQYSRSNFSVSANELNIPPYYVNDYKKALNNYKGKLDYIISLFKEYDLKSKGVYDIGTNPVELTKELIYKVLLA